MPDIEITDMTPARAGIVRAYFRIAIVFGEFRIGISDLRLCRDKIKNRTWLAFPSEKKRRKCRCGTSIAMGDRFCFSCGAPQQCQQQNVSFEVCAPMNIETRKYIFSRLVAKYEEETGERLTD